MESKSFWSWLINGIKEGLHSTFHLVYQYWYVLCIYTGSLVTFLCLIGYFADPMIKPWMILYSSIGVAIFMIGLYGYWRKSVKQIE